MIRVGHLAHFKILKFERRICLDNTLVANFLSGTAISCRSTPVLLYPATKTEPYRQVTVRLILSTAMQLRKHQGHWQALSLIESNRAIDDPLSRSKLSTFAKRKRPLLSVWTAQLTRQATMASIHKGPSACSSTSLGSARRVSFQLLRHQAIAGYQVRQIHLPHLRVWFSNRLSVRLCPRSYMA